MLDFSFDYEIPSFRQGSIFLRRSMSMRARTEHGTPNIEHRTPNPPWLSESACGSPSPIYHLLSFKRSLGWWNGRHVRLRGVCRKACGFKSRPEHSFRFARRAAIFGIRISFVIRVSSFLMRFFLNGILPHQRTLTIGKRLTSYNQQNDRLLTQPEKKFRKFYPLFCELLVVRQHLYLV